MQAFYKYARANDDGKTVRAMDALAPRIGRSSAAAKSATTFSRQNPVAASELKKLFRLRLELRKSGGSARRVWPGLRATDALTTTWHENDHPRRGFPSEFHSLEFPARARPG